MCVQKIHISTTRLFTLIYWKKALIYFMDQKKKKKKQKMNIARTCTHFFNTVYSIRCAAKTTTTTKKSLEYFSDNKIYTGKTLRKVEILKIQHMCQCFFKQETKKK